MSVAVFKQMTVGGVSFCVEGRTLHLLGTSIGSTGQINVDSDLTAMKQ